MLNLVQLIGNVGKDPERSKDNAPAKFTLATTYRYTDRNGEKVSQTTWHNIVVWGKLGDIVMKYVTKGLLIYISGRIDYQKYEKDGVTKYSTAIIGDELKMLGKKDGATTHQAPPPQPAAHEEISVDDIPF